MVTIIEQKKTRPLFFQPKQKKFDHLVKEKTKKNVSFHLSFIYLLMEKHVKLLMLFFFWPKKCQLWGREKNT